ncbi:hypothetical protein NOF04DRAFT_18336 [Fusarium oxysporum II5]|uniref:Uncharacterized protein n=2 Tax=Fusarium oxysporum species complex TaxID=171631 RepID=X0J403_FUSO5|nr:uncharacterized protein FOIG_15821 [Fusarium odoratissimum NRRL 54006]EXL91020.1 hypothetical protein FOIG_15821 [Fusarium odoratissimum NRRL 54006]KAK2126443.1 hypothetical protein NOF04DRAFT_18336 [Fusarium oxysporum II5]TXC00487.1 hypothetical protein FocTR4_00014666 [Fusarium oxysporum f. sp. cubense]
MIESTSGFVKSSIPLYHSALKSFSFKCAELLMGIFIFKLFSLIAARSNQFTAYLMFTEDYIQQSLFISSRGISRGGLVVLLFSLLSVTSSLYGTLLWALDSPGYIFQATNTTVAADQRQRNENPPYIIQLALDPTELRSTGEKLPQIIGAELFNPGLNYSLTGKVDNSHGTPEVVAPTRQGLGIGARIWLDGDGFSVSPDTNAMMPYTDTMNMTLFSSCILFNEGSAVWNCTFNNAEAQSIIEGVTGLPEVHWNDATDEDMDSRYIRPNRADNIWVSLGTGGGSAFMNQVFTVTKETRRHTFFQSTFKATMVTNPGIPFGQYEVADFVNRTWSTSTDQDSTKEANPLMGRIIYDIMGAQDQGASYQFGANTADNNNKSALQKNWGYYTPQVNNASMYSLISITTTKITLIRSETLSEAPEPFEKCERSNFQNEGFGGKVTQTDCTSSKAPDVKHGFFGQVDTAAVMITRGLGAARSNISAQSLDEKSLTWLRDNSGAIEALLTARAYSVSIDPSLVELSVDKLMVAMSSLQLFLTCLALVLAAVIWIGLMYSAHGHWSSTLLGNLIHTTSEMNEANPGYVKKAPEITLLPMGRKKVLAVDGGTLTISNTGLTSMQPFATFDPFPGDPKGHMEVDAYSLSYGDQYTGRQRLLSSNEPNYMYRR